VESPGRAGTQIPRARRESGKIAGRTRQCVHPEAQVGSPAGETKLQELASQYGSNYPQYQRQLSENQNLRKRLNAEMRKVVEGIANSARQSRQREAELRKAMEAQRARLLGLKDGRNEFTVLKRNVESAERAYDTAMQRHVVSQVESRASQSNVTLLNAAPVPGKPTQPKIRLNIALSVVVGPCSGSRSCC